MMKTRKRAISIAAIVLVAAGLAAGFALAQDSEDVAAASDSEAVHLTFLAHVAANLGVDESALVDAMQLAQIQEIDEAVADGVLTEEQADALKARIDARQALQSVIEDAIASGDLTEEQAELLSLRGLRGGMMGDFGGLRDVMNELRGSLSEDGQSGRSSDGFGFMLRTPRGVFGGRICDRP